MKSLTFTSLLLGLGVVFQTGCKTGKGVSQGESQQGSRGGVFQKKTLESVSITDITINYVAMFGADGEKWDSWAPGSESPDVYAVLKFRDQLLLQTEAKEDLAFGVTASLDGGLPVTLSAWNSEHVLYIYDEDGVTADDNIAYFSFIPSEYEKKEELVLGSREGTVQVTLKLKWNYAEK